MDKSSKRGKIPQQDWPSIIARHEAGETLASIARTYDCSPPAISYIVSRSRARKAVGEPAAPGTATAEPQLVKAHTGAPAVTATARQQDEPPPAAAAESHLGERPWAAASAAPRHDGSNGDGDVLSHGLPVAAPPGNGDARRTLHLSLGGHTARPAAEAAPRPGEPTPPRPAADRIERYPGERRELTATAIPAAADSPAAPRNGGGAALDHALRERVDADIAAFLAAFDAAMASDTVESRTGLREATDRLLRAGARTRIELERLEARAPLTPRERGAHAASAWRAR